MISIRDLDQKSHIAEAYRTVRTNISFSDIDNELKTILFTSTKQNEGKSTVISNVAYAFSKLENKKILLMDLDLRNPTVHRMFSVSNTFGIMEYLKNDKPLDKCIHKIEDDLHILPVGMMPPNPSEILASKKMREFLKNIKKDYDYIFIDSPPVGIVSDASIISKSIDGVIYIVGANETDISHANVAIENLKKVDANIIGAVLNKYAAEDSMHGYYGYYCEEVSSSGKRNKGKKKGFFNILAR